MTRRPLSLAALAALAVLLPALAPAALHADDAETPPGRGPVGKCAGAGVTIDIGSAVAKGGDLTTGGTWKVRGSADGVYLEVRLNSNRYHAEIQQGASGRYGYSTDFPRCGSQVLRVFACPTVREDGREKECLARGQAVIRNLNIDCTPAVHILRCEWDCGDASEGCAGTCTAEAQGGDKTLVGLWGVNDTDYATVGGPPYGPWTAVVRCKPGERVTFRARDQAGVGTLSPPAEKLCGAE